MSFGTRLAKSAEQDRQRALRQAQSHEESPSGQETSSPSPAAAPNRVNSRPGGGFRPGGGNKPITRDRDEARIAGPNISVAVEDGVGTVQVIRRLLEVSAVRDWPHSKVARIEALAHEDPASAWSQVSADWEQLCEDRRRSVASRDSGQISFRIVSSGVARESQPTGPRASSMALLHGLDMVRLPVERSPFTPETVANVAAWQRKLRQEAVAVASSLRQDDETREQPQPSSQDENSNSPTPSAGRFVRNMR